MPKVSPTKLIVVAMLLTPLPAFAQGGGGGGSGGGSAGGASAGGAASGSTAGSGSAVGSPTARPLVEHPRWVVGKFNCGEVSGWKRGEAAG